MQNGNKWNGLSLLTLIEKEKGKGVGPSYVTDIHRNDPEIWANIGPILDVL